MIYTKLGFAGLVKRSVSQRCYEQMGLPGEWSRTISDSDQSRASNLIFEGKAKREFALRDLDKKIGQGNLKLRDFIDGFQYNSRESQTSIAVSC